MILSQLARRLKNNGLTASDKIVVCTHATFSTVQLCRALKTLGAHVVFHPVSYSREPTSIEELRALGVEVIEDKLKLLPYIAEADCAIEDGARISKLIASQNISLKKNFYSVEQTSGGANYFVNNPPVYPVINVAMSAVKLHVENLQSTPESIIRSYSTATGKLFAGKRVLIIGYGSIGQGVASLANTLGAKVTVSDVLSVKRLFADRDGFDTVRVQQLDQVLGQQDIIVMATNTYQGNLLDIEQVMLMKDGAEIVNAGSGRGELAEDLQHAKTFQRHDAQVTIVEDRDLHISLEKMGTIKTITAIGLGYPINLHLGTGTSHDAIEVVMALLLTAIVHGPTTRLPGLQHLPMQQQELVADIALDQLEHNLDTPIHINTEDLPSIIKPYGGITPFHNELGEAAKLSAARAWFAPASKTRGHYHAITQEAYYVESGRADIILSRKDNSTKPKTYHMKTGDYLLVPEDYFHDVQVTSKTKFVCLVFSAPSFSQWDQFFRKDKANAA